MAARPNTAHSSKSIISSLPADFSYLQQKGYHVIKQIDRGSYGVVYKAEDKNTGRIVAIKINFNIISSDQLFIQIGLLTLMRQKTRLPYLHQIVQQNATYCIIMNYYKSKPFITFFNKFSIKDVKHYIYQLLQGLQQLKTLGIYHRDIKPSNFLYDEQQKRGFIVDYGLAEIDPKFIQDLREKVQQLQNQEDELYQQQNQKLGIYENIQFCLGGIGKNKIGTQIFMPPQSILRNDNQTYSSDIWPVGVILLQFASKRYNIFSNLPKLQQHFKLQKHGFHVSYFLQLANLFGKAKVIEACKNYFGFQLTLPSMLKETNLYEICIMEGFDETAKDLLGKILQLNPADRITVQQALNHQFFLQILNDHTQI